MERRQPINGATRGPPPPRKKKKEKRERREKREKKKKEKKKEIYEFLCNRCNIFHQIACTIFNF